MTNPPLTMFQRHGSGLLFLGFGNRAFDRLWGRRFAAMRDDSRGPLGWLIRRPEVGGGFRGGGDIPPPSVFQRFLRPFTPLRAVAVDGQENAAAPDPARVPLGDSCDISVP